MTHPLDRLLDIQSRGLMVQVSLTVGLLIGLFVGVLIGIVYAHVR